MLGGVRMGSGMLLHCWGGPKIGKCAVIEVGALVTAYTPPLIMYAVRAGVVQKALNEVLR